MSYKQSEQASYEALIDHTSSVIAGLLALGETDLALPWQTLRQALKAQRDARDEARWTLLGAQRTVAVRDAAWDAVVTDLSGRAYLASGKQADQAPYVLLFGGISANDSRQLGPAKATAFGSALLRKGGELRHPELEQGLARLAIANADLEAAHAARLEARAAAEAHAVPRLRAVEAVERLTAETEVGILTKNPGRRDLVRAVLAPQRADAKDEGVAQPVPLPA